MGINVHGYSLRPDGHRLQRTHDIYDPVYRAGALDPPGHDSQRVCSQELPPQDTRSCLRGYLVDVGTRLHRIGHGSKPHFSC